MRDFVLLVQQCTVSLIKSAVAVNTRTSHTHSRARALRLILSYLSSVQFPPNDTVCFPSDNLTNY